MWDASGGTSRMAGMGTGSSYTHFTASEVEAQRSGGGTLTIWKSEMEPRLEPKFSRTPLLHHPKPEHTPEVLNSTGCVSVFLRTVPERLLDMPDKRKRDRDTGTGRQRDSESERREERDRKERQRQRQRERSQSYFLNNKCPAHPQSSQPHCY